MKTDEYFAEGARTLLAVNGLADFASIWSLECGWFEEPNQRRGGWSGVSRYQLSDGSGIFIKRQQNHFFRSWHNLFLPVPTFRREFANILKFSRLHIPALELVYFGQRKIHGDMQCILITRELHRFNPLDSQSLQPDKLPIRVRRNLIETAATVVRRMHDAKIQHNCLYAKHVFAKTDENSSAEIRLIDLEKAKWRPFRYLAVQRDLGTLYRHTEGWSRTDKLRFFLAYKQERKISKQSRHMISSILKKSVRATKAVDQA